MFSNDGAKTAALGKKFSRVKMIKSTNSIYNIDYPAKSVLTPIRDSGQDFFVTKGNAGKFGQFGSRIPEDFNPYAKSMWTTEDGYKNNAQKLKKITSMRRDKVSFQEADSKELIASNLSPTEPLDLKLQKETKSQLSSEFTDKGKAFLTSFYSFLKREEDYAYFTDSLNMVYRKELHDHKSKHRLIDRNSNDEILLFGNMDTISQLSRILVKSLKNYMKACCDTGNILFQWDGYDSHMNVTDKFEDLFDPSDFLISHLNKIRSTYSTYILSRQKQLQLICELRKLKSAAYYKWYETCLKKADFNRLEDILEAPMKRIHDFYDDLLDVSTHAEGFISPEACGKIKSFLNRYLEFSDECQHLLGSNIPKSEGKLSKPLSPHSDAHLTVPASDTSCRSSDSRYSLSSSRYSDHSSFELSRKQSAPSSSSTDIQKENPTLADCIRRFKLVESHAIKLEKELTKLDLAAILDENLRQAEEWRNIFEFEPLSDLLTEHTNVESIYTIYIDKIHQQRQEVMLIKLGDLQEKVLSPLRHIIQCCKAVHVKIQDLKYLKKDYMAFLQAKDTRNVKMEIVVKHFLSLQGELLSELPTFLHLTSQFTIYLISFYNRIMLDYLRVLSGGSRLLKRELQLLETGEREPGDNFDILQSFSSSRFYTKQLIHENWNCHGRAMESRLVRGLFEI